MEFYNNSVVFLSLSWSLTCTPLLDYVFRVQRVRLVLDDIMASTLQQAKKLLRKRLKFSLARLTLDERERESQVVIQKLVSSEHFKDSQRISGEKCPPEQRLLFSEGPRPFVCPSVCPVKPVDAYLAKCNFRLPLLRLWIGSVFANVGRDQHVASGQKDFWGEQVLLHTQIRRRLDGNGSTSLIRRDTDSLSHSLEYPTTGG